MGVPVYDAFVVCLVNKNGRDEEFDERDETLVFECYEAIRGAISNALALDEERRLRTQGQSLLSVAKNLFRHLDDVPVLLGEIMAEARRLTQAERCSLFLLDEKNNELVAKVFDIGDGQTTNNGDNEVRIPADSGIAGHVAQSGVTLNIRDAQSHPLFYRNVDQETGFKTKTILCFPIKEDDSKVIGVAELCNKDPDLTASRHFNRFDEEIAEAFSAYCGIAIMHSLMYKKVADAQYRSRLSNELMMYHMKVSQLRIRIVPTTTGSNCTMYASSLFSLTMSDKR